MTPGSLLMMSGAIILVAVSAYDYVAECAVAEELRRRRHRTYADNSPGSPFATRLAQYGLTSAEPNAQPENPAQAIVGRQTATDVPDLLDDLDAFHAWLLEDRSTAPARPQPVLEEQDRHLPPAGALSGSESKEEAPAAEPSSLGLLDSLSHLALAADLRREPDAAGIR